MDACLAKFRLCPVPGISVWPSCSIGMQFPCPIAFTLFACHSLCCYAILLHRLPGIGSGGERQVHMPMNACSATACELRAVKLHGTIMPTLLWWSHHRLMAERGAGAQEPWPRNAIWHDVQDLGHHAAAVPVGRCARCARGVRRNPIRSLFCA